MLCKKCGCDYPKGIDVCPDCCMVFDYSKTAVSESDLTRLAKYYIENGDNNRADGIYKIVNQINPRNTIAANRVREINYRKLQSLISEAQELEARGIWDNNSLLVNSEILKMYSKNEEAMKRIEEFDRRNRADRKEKLEEQKKFAPQQEMSFIDSVYTNHCHRCKGAISSLINKKCGRCNMFICQCGACMCSRSRP